MFLPFVTASLFKCLFKNPLHPLFGDLYYCEPEWWSCVINTPVRCNASRWTTNAQPFTFSSEVYRKKSIQYYEAATIFSEYRITNSNRPYENIDIGQLACKNTWHYHHIIADFTDYEFSSRLDSSEERKKNINSLRHRLTNNMPCKFTFYKL